MINKKKILKIIGSLLFAIIILIGIVFAANTSSNDLTSFDVLIIDDDSEDEIAKSRHNVITQHSTINKELEYINSIPDEIRKLTFSLDENSDLGFSKITYDDSNTICTWKIFSNVIFNSDLINNIYDHNLVKGINNILKIYV